VNARFSFAVDSAANERFTFVNNISNHLFRGEQMLMVFVTIQVWNRKILFPT